jgi:SAM-dependent methyltransferase
MLERARAHNPAALVQGDAFAIPCAEASFDVAITLRLAFHFASLEPLLREMARVVAPTGLVIFDTYLWSPRAWFPFDSAHWGSGVYIHSPAQVEKAAHGLGLRIEQSEYCFLFSPYVYRRLPLPLVHTLASLEQVLPRRLHARVFWKLKRTV